MKLYKLTDRKGQALNGCQWGEGVTHDVEPGQRTAILCSPGVIHAYKSANLALLLNPIHANFDAPRLWEAEGEIIAHDWGKCGVHRLTVVTELPLPDWWTNEATQHRVQIRFAVICASAVLANFEAEYPSDKRPRLAIEAAETHLKSPSTDAAHAAHAAAYAAHAAHAAHAAYAADAAAYAADAAAHAAHAAHAAEAAADAAAYAADATGDLDFEQLADEAVRRMERDGKDD